MTTHASEPHDQDAWKQHGLCRSDGILTERFYPDSRASTTFARNMCRVCPVKEECLEHALVNDEKYGIWGGTTERDRRVIKRQRVTDRRAAS